MIRTFFILSVVVGLLLLSQRFSDDAGTTVMVISNVKIEFNSLFLIQILIVSSLFVFYWGQVWHFLVNFPKRLRNRNNINKINDGLSHLYKAYDALAAGDGSAAKRHAQKTEKLLPNPRISAMLQAEVAHLNGDEQMAQLQFKKLADDEKDPFLGLRGLLAGAYRNGHYLQALEWAQKAYKLRPKSTWALEMLFEIYMHTGRFEQALSLMSDVYSKAIYDKKQASLFEVVLRLKVAESMDKSQFKDAVKMVEKGLKVKRDFVPLILLQAKLCEENQQFDKAEKTLANFWRENPSNDVLKAWIHLVERTNPDALVKKAVALTKSLINEPHGALAMAEIYKQENELEKARELLVSALKMEKISTGYTLLSEVDDELRGGNAGYKWLKKAQGFPEAETLCEGGVEAYENWCKTYITHENSSDDHPLNVPLLEA